MLGKAVIIEEISAHSGDFVFRSNTYVIVKDESLHVEQ